MELYHNYARAKRAKEASERNLFLYSTPWERWVVLITNLFLLFWMVISAFQSTGTTVLIYIFIAFLLLLNSLLLLPTILQVSMEPEDSRFGIMLDDIAELNPFRSFPQGTYYGGGWEEGWGVGAYLFLRLLIGIPAILTDFVCGLRGGSSGQQDYTILWILLGLAAIIVVVYLLPYLFAAIFTYLFIFFHTFYFVPEYLYREKVEREKEQALRRHIESCFEAGRIQNPHDIFANLLEQARIAYEIGEPEQAVTSLNSLLLFVIGSESQTKERERLIQFLEDTLSLTGLAPYEYHARLKKLLKRAEGKEKEWAIRLALLKFQEEASIPPSERQIFLRSLYPQLWTLSPHPTLLPFLKQAFRFARDVESWEKMKTTLSASLESQQWQVDLRDILWVHLRLAGLDSLLQSISPEESSSPPLSREEVQKALEEWKNSRIWTYRQLASAMEGSEWRVNSIALALMGEILSAYHPDSRTIYILASLLYYSQIDVDFVNFALFSLEFAFSARMVPATEVGGGVPFPLIAEKVKEVGIRKASQLYSTFQQNLLQCMKNAVRAPLFPEPLVPTG